MTIALHAHHIAIIATLAFSLAAVLPYWYTAQLFPYKQNVLSVCIGGACNWIFAIRSSGSPTLQQTLVFLMACLGVACCGISLIGLVLGSWYIQRSAAGINSKWILISAKICILFCFLCSGSIWSLMLTTNKWQLFPSNTISISDFDFAFWLGLGAAIGYLYAFLLYLIALCKTC